MHAVLAGRTDKATSYANKALGLLQQQQQENQFKGVCVCVSVCVCVCEGIDVICRLESFIFSNLMLH